MPTPSIPFIPDDAPFTPDQRAWLNGFLAGLYSNSPPVATVPAEVRTLTLLVASQTGTGDTLGRAFAKEARQRGFTVMSLAMDRDTPTALRSVETLLMIASTHGEGEPPDNAHAFYERLHQSDAPRLEKLRYAVLALGDSNYEHFAKCGKDFDERLAALGANRLVERTDSDVDVDEPFERWKSAVFVALERKVPATASKSASNGTPSRRGVPVRLVAKPNLNGSGSEKETRHVVFALEDSSLAYEPGDALGVLPQNCPRAISRLLSAVGFSGDEAVPDGSGGSMPLRTALRDRYAIGKLAAPVLRSVAERAHDASLLELFEASNADQLREFLYGREVIDLFSMVRGVSMSAPEFVGMLGKLAPRLYSIASSPRAHPGEVHLTVSVVRYNAHRRDRQGVCSTYLSERIGEGDTASVYVQRNSRFRLPADGDRPIVMIGPGTGIAPFRAFLADRRATGATGKNWLFFGDRNVASDFLYREELEELVASGHLTHLQTAFSRDQRERVYVQQRMLEEAQRLYEWLEEGAHIYVCGDATRMAKDVDAALHAVVARSGGLGETDAAAYVERLREEGRYQRDVY